MNESEILPAPVLNWPPPETKWQREQRAFVQMLPQLLASHRGQYVAIHDGQLVDSGAELVPLAKRVYVRYGYVPIWIDLVTDQPQPPVRIPSPRVVCNEPKP
jgi:hypothetical protein